MAQLKACQLDSEELQAYQCDLKPLQQKINDLGNIMQIYNDSKCGVLDNSDTLALTCMMLDKSVIVKNTYYIFAGFDDFTSQGYCLIERLMKHSKGVFVNAYTSSNFNKNIYYQDVLYRLIALCNTLGANYDLIDYPYTDDNLHTYLTNNLFAFNKLSFNTSNEKIRLYQAQNILDELEFIARDIRKKILQGARFRDFGVAVYNLNSFTDVIKQVFNKYDLCIYLDVQKGFSSTCIYRFFINMWLLYSKNYDTINLIELINSPFINIPQNHKVEIVQTISRLGYRGNLEKLHYKNEEINTSIQSINEFLNKYKLDITADINQILQWHNQLIEDLDMEQTIASLVNKIDDAYEQKILSQAIKSSIQLLNEIKEFYPTSNLDEIIDIYTQAGVEQKISPLPLSADCIQIVDVNEVLTSFDNLYMVNCSSTTAPNILQDVGILLDKELTYVQLSHDIEPTIARMNRLNKFKLFNSSLMFNKTLCVSMSLNSPSETSALVTELKSRLFVSNDKNEEANIGYIYPSQIRNEQIYTPLSLWDLIEYIYTNKLELSDNVKQIINKTNISQNPTDISINPNLCELSEISASALENYFQCPLKYLFNYVLKLKDPISSDIEMLDIGNILHEVAHSYYLRKDRESLDITNFCNYTINKILQKDEKLSQHINSPILINLISEAIRFINHLRTMDRNSKFIPTYFEKPFGNNHNLSALPLTDKISLKGKIDRIDMFEDYFRIIDYKSGNSNATLGELYYGKKLQLFLYSLAIQEATGKTLSGTFYMPVKNVVNPADDDKNVYQLMGFYTENNDIVSAYDINIPTNLKTEFVNMTLKKDGTIKKTEKVLSPSEMENLLNYSKEISINALDEIASGKFKASPLKYNALTNACTYCPYLTLCSKSSNNIPFRVMSKVDKNSFTGGSDE